MSQTTPPTEFEADSSFVVDYIDIIGIVKTRPEVVRRNLDFSTGQTITTRDLERNYLRLMATNFFRDITFSSRPGSRPGRIGIVVEVRERWWPTLHFEGGNSELDGWYFSPLTIRADNIFGHGNYNRARLIYGDRLSALDFEFYDPTFAIKNTYLKLNLTALSRNLIHYLDNQRTTGKVSVGEVRASWGGTRGLFSHVSFELKSKTVDADSFANVSANPDEKILLPTSMLRDAGKIQRRAMALVLHEDTRDNTVYPTKGLWGAVWAEYSKGRTGHYSDFSRFILDTRYYRKVTSTHVFAVRLKAGQTSASTPFYERFYLGGPNSLRGYPDRRLAPVGYGTKLLLTNLEYRFPLTQNGFPKHSWTGVFFLDVGGIWNETDIVHWKSLNSGAGFGVRVKLPVVGLVRLEWAIPLQVKDYQLQLSLAHMF